MVEGCRLPLASRTRDEVAAAAFGVTIRSCFEEPITPEVTNEKIDQWQEEIGRCDGPRKSNAGCDISMLFRDIMDGAGPNQ